MEEPARSKGGIKIFKYLPTATSFSIRNPPYSPGRRDRRSENSKLMTHNNRAYFSGPIGLIPAEARDRGNRSGTFEEPTSPKVSCMGQVTHKKRSSRRYSKSSSRRAPPPKPHKKPSFTIAKMFRRKVRPGRQPEMDVDCDKASAPARPVPSLREVKKFSSSRATLSDFDWMAQSRAADRLNRANCGMNEDSEEEDEIIIAHSAPIMMGSGGGGGGGAVEAKKEVNLWKRRTMGAPRPLQVN